MQPATLKLPSIRQAFPLVVIGVMALGYGVLASLDTNDRAVANAATVEEKKGKPYKPVATLEVVMYQVDKYFADFEEDIKKKKFRTLAKTSMFVAEIMNLTSHYNEEKEWKSISKKTLDLLVELHKASKAKDGTTAASLIPKVDAACEQCHEKYRDEE